MDLLYKKNEASLNLTDVIEVENEVFFRALFQGPDCTSCPTKLRLMTESDTAWTNPQVALDPSSGVLKIKTNTGLRETLKMETYTDKELCTFIKSASFPISIHVCGLETVTAVQTEPILKTVMIGEQP